MLVQEVPAGGSLFGVQASYELHVYGCPSVSSVQSRLVRTLGVVQGLPRAKGCTHGRSYEEVGFLASQRSPGLLPSCLTVEVPRFAVRRVAGREVHREPWQEMSTP